MKAFVFASILMLAAALVAQQPGTSGNPRPGYPPLATPNQQMPPDQPAPAAPDSTATAQVQQDIQQAWQSQSDLSNAKLNAQVSGGSVTVTGTVSDETQHQKALQIAALHASGMRIVDKIKVQPQ